MDQSEFGRIKNLLTASCATTTVAPWGTRPTATSTSGLTVTTNPAVASATTLAPVAIGDPVGVKGVREVNRVRCKKAEFGQTGQNQGIPYVCSDHDENGKAYSAGYYMWRPA
jgi:hypothetical protein